MCSRCAPAPAACSPPGSSRRAGATRARTALSVCGPNPASRTPARTPQPASLPPGYVKFLDIHGGKGPHVIHAMREMATRACCSARAAPPRRTPLQRNAARGASGAANARPRRAVRTGALCGGARRGGARAPRQYLALDVHLRDERAPVQAGERLALRDGVRRRLRARHPPAGHPASAVRAHTTYVQHYHTQRPCARCAPGPRPPRRGRHASAPGARKRARLLLYRLHRVHHARVLLQRRQPVAQHVVRRAQERQPGGSRVGPVHGRWTRSRDCVRGSALRGWADPSLRNGSLPLQVARGTSGKSPARPPARPPARGASLRRR